MSQQHPQVLKLKIICLGPVSCGKSSLVHRIKNGGGGDLPLTRPTVFADISSLHFSADDLDPSAPRVVVSISDTSGQERVQAMAVSKSTFRGAHVAFMIYAIDDRKSFDAIFEKWMPLVQDEVDRAAVFILVGNKSDLEEERQVEKSEADAAARARGMSFFELSAKTYANVDSTYKFAVRTAVKRQQEAMKSPVQQPPSFNLRQQAPQQQVEKKDSSCPC